jgi:hypothetical protein
LPADAPKGSDGIGKTAKDGDVQMAALDPKELKLDPPALALPAPSAEDTEPAEGAQDAARQKEFALRAQQELQRLGCYRSVLDGNWSAKSARALLRYYAERKIAPDEVEPNQKLIDLLTAEQQVVCKRTEPVAKKAAPSKSPSKQNTAPQKSNPGTAAKSPAPKNPVAKARPKPVAKVAPVAKPKPKVVATTKPAAPKTPVKKPVAKPIVGLFR